MRRLVLLLLLVLPLSAQQIFVAVASDTLITSGTYPVYSGTLSSNWTIVLATPSYPFREDALGAYTATTANNCAVYTAASFANNQYSEAVQVDSLQDGILDQECCGGTWNLLVRSNSAITTYYGYGQDETGWNMYKSGASVSGEDGNLIPDGHLAYLSAVTVGSTVVITLYDVTAQQAMPQSWTDTSSIITSGAPGFCSGLDHVADWVGGNILTTIKRVGGVAKFGGSGVE